MPRKNKLLLWLALFCIILGVLSALLPVSDCDNDGLLDSFITEGFILMPVIFTLTGLFFFLTRIPVVSLSVPRLVATLLVPPPITTR